MFIPISDWFPAFLLTFTVELPIVVGLLRQAEVDVPRLVVLVAFANLATHLVVWYVFSQALLVGTPEYVVVAEGWAVGAEAIFYLAAVPGVSRSRAFAVAGAANLASFLVGRAVRAVLPSLLAWSLV
jgi:hypothetical protein